MATLLQERKARSESSRLGIYTRSIVRAWNATTEQDRAEGVQWYDAAYLEAASMDPDRPERAVGVIAALSQMTEWSLNLRNARAMIQAIDAGLPTPAMGTGSMRQSAARIALGESLWDVLQGPKVRAFAASILGREDVPCIDRWAVRIAVGRDLPHPPKGRVYDLLARAYVRAAERVGESPRTVQAATWVSVRKQAKSI